MKIDFDPSRPIYMQIMLEFKRRLVNGSLKPGEKVLSVRELAAAMGVTPNTLQRAFSELEREGLLKTERTSGRYVTEDESKLAALRLEMSNSAVEGYFNSMGSLGFGIAEAKEAVANYKINKGEES
jgi:DNA-binding transcriptional regulator YhcF (GntR family)